MIIAVDFDGTVVTHDYPEVGKDVGAVPVLKELVAKGHQIMLWTMRGSNNANALQDAVNWYKSHDIPLWGINENPRQQACGWIGSHKQFADIYIDDAALGCPLIYNTKISLRSFADWTRVREMLITKGVI